MYEFLGWGFKQINAYERYIDLVKKFMTGGIPVKKIFSVFLASVELLCAALFKTPYTPCGDPIDLSSYELVFEDEFDGDELDLDVWKHRGEGARRAGFNADSQAKVEDGNLVITGEYREDGKYGEGFYTGAVSLREHYLRGYYEIRCKLNKGPSFWSAFWLQGLNGPYDHELSNGGINSVEIDIFESISNGLDESDKKGVIYSTIHCNGVDDNVEKIDSCTLGEFKVKDPFNEYHTYGLLWTEDEYIFYVDGVESVRSTFGKGVCINPEEVIVSLELPDEMDKSIADKKDYKTQMIVDYVRIYQLPETK